ncbi:MAG: radical SAM family heme chaperone HemW, partial [Chitinophagaceae bacterium]
MAGIYIHIPFCRQACHYCNFHFSTNQDGKENTLQAIVKEIELTQPFDNSEVIDTIYFGGGTPSLLNAHELNTILATAKKTFNVNPSAEITLEANPDDISPAVLEGWLKLGINRLSLGVQSFNEAELKWMNRAHNASQSLQSIDDIKAAGFLNFSVDLIYGSPLLSNEAFEKNVNIIIEKSIPHISCYALTVEEKTALHHLIEKKRSLPVDELRQAEQFQLLLRLTEAAGYEQYEISNFSKPGFRSKHNSSYWQGKPYYGFGPSAHSYDGKNKRRWNIANNALYVQSLEKNAIPFEEEVLTPTQQLNEYIMISLRTMEGMDLNRIASEFGKDKEQVVEEAAQKFMDEKLLIKKERNISLTKEG